MLVFVERRQGLLRIAPYAFHNAEAVLSLPGRLVDHISKLEVGVSCDRWHALLMRTDKNKLGRGVAISDRNWYKIEIVTDFHSRTIF